MGNVAENRKAMVVGYLRPNGSFYGEMFYERYAKRVGFDGEEATGEENDVQIRPFDVPQRSPLMKGVIGTGVYRFLVAIDVPYSEFFAKANADMDTLVEHLDVAAAKNAAIYVRDAMLVQEVSHIVVRTNAAEGPYRTKETATREVMNEEWDEIGSDLLDIEYDKLLLIGGSSAHRGGTTAAGDVKGDVWRHELGHTFDPSNDEGGAPEGTTIMVRYKYQSRFSTTELHAIVNYRNKNANWMDYSANFTLPTPPYGNYDFVQATRGDEPVNIDVLANDHDANANDVLSITAFDTNSILGGTISRSIGTGTNGNDELIYTVPDHMVGTDHFFYTVDDGTGFAFEGVVVIELKTAHDIYEAEDATTTGSVKDDRVYATGSEYVKLDSKGEYIEWNPNISEAGWYGLKVRFGQSTETSSSFSLKINKTKVGSNLVTMMTGKKAEWENAVNPRVFLNKGINKIRLTSTDSIKKHVDHLLIHSGNDIRINFTEPATADDPSLGWVENYCQDGGAPFGNRGYGDLHYGWKTNVNDAVVRGFADVPRSDLASFNHLQKGSDKTWKIALENKAYHVYVMCGDGGYPDLKKKPKNRITDALNHVNTIQVGDLLFTDPDEEIDYFDAYHGVVNVTNGFLTITPADGALNAKICFIWICDASNTAPKAKSLKRAIPQGESDGKLVNLGNYGSDAESPNSDLSYSLPFEITALGNRVVMDHTEYRARFTATPDFHGTDHYDYIVADPQGASATGRVTFIVEPAPNNAPVADAGTDMTELDADNSGVESVTLDGSGSSDSDGTIVSYSWTVEGVQVATGVSVDYAAPVGTTTVKLTVTDNSGDSSTDTVLVTVNEPPVIDVLDGIVPMLDSLDVPTMDDTERGTVMDFRSIPGAAPVSLNEINLSKFSNKSWSIWFKTEDVDTRQVLYEQGGGLRGANIYLDAGAVVMGIWGMDGADPVYISGSVSTGTWHHAALVLDGNMVETYLNGGSLTNAPGGSLSKHSGGIGIGYVNENTKMHDDEDIFDGSHAFNGLIDDLRVYDRSLTSNEVTRIFEFELE